jgi:hypothetical protein
MLIIFNLWAIPVGIVIYLVLVGLEHVAPGLMAEGRSGWTIGVVTTLVGAVCNLVGLKGRVFLLPIWMIGLGIICYHLGWPGTIAFIVLLVGGGIWFFKGAKKREAADWQKVLETAIQAGTPPAGADEIQFWEWVKATLFLPTWLDCTPELCQHNLKVIREIQQAGRSLAPDEQAKLQALQQFLTAAQNASKPPGSEMNIQTPVSELVAARLRSANRNARRQKRQKLSSPHAVPASR